ncbi:MAG: hypothetical protein ACOCWU_05815 [Spirochaetota bacterium]
MSEAVKAQGLDALAVFATLLLVLQSFVGLPIASFCLKRESTRLVEAFRAGETGTIGNSGKTIASDPEVPSWRLFPQLPKSLRTPFVLIAKALLIVSFVLSRILDYSWELSLAISTTCLFGFPATYIISEEVSESQSRNGEEKEFLIKQILPKMLVAGFTTVTIASVILAGIIVNLL